MKRSARVGQPPPCAFAGRLGRTCFGRRLRPSALLVLAIVSLLAVWAEPARATREPEPQGAGAPEGVHGAAHGGEQEFNWFYGFWRESAEDEPGLLWRPPGTPVPFVAVLLNYGLLFYLLYRFSRRPLTEALSKRKSSLMHGIAEANRMRVEAQAQLEDGQRKLDGIDQQIEHVREESKSAGEAERSRVLREAEEKRARLARDAQVLVEQEFKAARERLHREIVSNAVRSAEEVLRTRVTAVDHERLQSEYLESVRLSLGPERGRAAQGDA